MYPECQAAGDKCISFADQYGIRDIFILMKTAHREKFAGHIKDALDQRRLSARAAEVGAGLPRRSIYSVIEGHSPTLDRAADICDALGLEFYVGPPRDPVSVSTPPLNTEISLPPGHLPDLEGHTQGLVRLTAQAGGDPIPIEFREGLETEFKQGIEADLREEIEAELRRESGVSEPSPEAWMAALREHYGLVRRHADVRLAAGDGAWVEDESVAGYVAFRKAWLTSHGLHAGNLSLVDVMGDSMEPELHAGDSVLVNHAQREPRHRRIYALRVEDGAIVKRLHHREGRWWADSDNPGYSPRALGAEDDIVGEVVWWAHTVEGR